VESAIEAPKCDIEGDALFAFEAIKTCCVSFCWCLMKFILVENK